MPLVQLDTENADRDLTSTVTCLTDTPSATEVRWCQGLIKLGDGAKNLDGTGGAFELTVSVGGQIVQPGSQVIAFDTSVRAAVWTSVFPVPAADVVLLRMKSPNGADTDVDVTATLYDVPVGDTLQLAGGAYKIADTTGNWATAGTWSDGVVPAAADNIIIRDGVTVTVAASLDLGTFGTLEVQGDGVLNIAAGQTVATVPSGWAIGTNSGTITTNNGTVTTNGSTVTTNNGTITDNNLGIITTNDGTVINNNAGTVTTNNCIVTTNSDTVTTNAGTVEFNVGTVTTNNAGAVVLHNYGTIGTDNGESDVPRVTLVDTTTTNTDLVTTTGTEEASVPAAAPSIRTMIQWIYQKVRNKETTSSSAGTTATSDGTTAGTSVLSDAGGTFTKGKQA